MIDTKPRIARRYLEYHGKPRWVWVIYPFYKKNPNFCKKRLGLRAAQQVAKNFWKNYIYIYQESEKKK